MTEDQAALLHRYQVTITCAALGAWETVVVEAANEGEAQPAAIAVCSLPLNGELIDFAVCEAGPTTSAA